MTSTGRHCKATTRNGKPCQSYAVGEGDLCYWHDPALAEARRASRAKGGLARHGRTIGPVAGDLKPVTIRTAADVLPVLEEAVNEVRRMEPSINKARALAYVCGMVVKAFEVTDLQKRVEALEGVLARREV